MIALALPEIRRLLIAFVLTRHHRPPRRGGITTNHPKTDDS